MPINGLDAVKAKLAKLAELKQVSLGELFNPEFLAANTNFPDVQEMFDRSGFKVASIEDIEAIPEEEWESYIAANTQFSSWHEMREAALGELLRKHLDS